VPRAALVAPGRACGRDPLRRARHRARARRRPLDQGRAAARRAHPDRPPRGADRGCGADQRRRRPLRVVRTRPRRRRRVLPPAHAERARCLRRVGGGERRRARRRRAEARRCLARARRRRPGRPGARRARAGGDRDRHVRGQLPGLVRPRPPRDELPGARRHDRQPRRTAAAAAAGRDPAVPGRARVDREARRAVRRRALTARVDRLRRDLRPVLRRHRLRRRTGAGAPPRRSRDDRAALAAAADGGAAGERASAADVSAALLRRRRRAHAGARVPAAARRDRHRGGGRRRPRPQQRRHRHRLLQRHLAGVPRARPARPDAGARAGAARRGRRAPRVRRGDALSHHEPWWISLITVALVINLVMAAFAYTTWLERKVLGRLQLRYGPNRAGPFGLLQPIADLIKLVRKEAFFPDSSHELPYILAPVVSCFTALAAFAVIPWGNGWTIDGYYVAGVVANVPISLILIFALGSIGIYGFIVGGWASDSKFSILGSMRTCAQLVSYEVSLALSVLGVVLMGQSLNLVDIVDKQQSTLWFFLPQCVGLAVFLIGGTAETSRPPFDLPEADTELVAGYHTEYSGMRWGLFQAAEYINLLTLSGLCVTLFFDGYHFPWVHSLDILGPIWFVLKLFTLVMVFIWLRATQPRLRYDQLMRFGWKVLLPVATLNA